jgi:hypothetical protein
MTAEQRKRGGRQRASTAPERMPSRPDRAAGRTATSRRWRRRGTMRPVAAQPDRRRPSGRATARNRRRGLRPALRPEPRAARKMRPSDCSLRHRAARPDQSFYCRGTLCHRRRGAASPGQGRCPRGGQRRLRQCFAAAKFHLATTANCRGNRASRRLVARGQQAKNDRENCVIYLDRSITCDITAYTLHQPRPMII